eukprot:1768301-Prymnesium_polylepis.1
MSVLCVGGFGMVATLMRAVRAGLTAPWRRDRQPPKCGQAAAEARCARSAADAAIQCGATPTADMWVPRGGDFLTHPG